MRKHQTTSTDQVGHEAHTASESLERNTDHHAVAASQREGPVEGSPEARGTVRIHTLSPAPFLKHPQLTPAQKRFLDSVAGPRSAERVYRLVRQHYLNVLHRCIRPGPQDEDHMVPVAEEEEEEEETTQEPEEPQEKAVRRAKHKQPIRTAAAAAKHSGKTSLSKLPAKKMRPPAKVKSPNTNKHKMETGSWSELLGEDHLEASLSESLSSLSMEDDQDSVYGVSPR